MATAPDGAPQAPEGAPSFWGRLYDLLGFVGGAILAVMAFAVFLQVVLRTLGRVGIDGLEEIPRYLFIWLVMLAGAAAMWRNEHTILDYFLNLMPPRLRALTVILVNVLMIVLFAWLIKLSFILVPNAQLQTSAGLNLPLGYVFAAVPIGAALFIVPMVRNIVREARSLWQKPS